MFLVKSVTYFISVAIRYYTVEICIFPRVDTTRDNGKIRTPAST